MEENRRGRSRRLIAAVLLAGLAASVAYGFLLHRDRLFPYSYFQGIFRALRPNSRIGEPRKPGAGTGGKAASIRDIGHVANLPYLRGYRPATEERAVRVHNPALCEDGLNLFTSGHAPVAILMDMAGAVRKTWTADAAKTFPGFTLDAEHQGNEKFLRDAELLADGGMVAIFDAIGLLRLDAASRVLWKWRGWVHHDVLVTEKGEIWTLLQEKRVVRELHGEEPVLDDFVLRLSPEGKLIQRLSLIESILKSSYASLLFNTPPRNPDVLHANSLSLLDGSLDGLSPAFRRGNLLVSIRNLSTIVVVDPDSGRVVWALSGQWRRQHSAHLLGNGHLLLFDNLGPLQAGSRVLELDSLTQKILWSWGARPGEDLESERMGWVERLPGGNTLITETKSGRVLEVTPDHRVAWEFVNPNRVGERNELIAAIYFMKRLGRDRPFLPRGSAWVNGSAASRAERLRPAPIS